MRRIGLLAALLAALVASPAYATTQYHLNNMGMVADYSQASVGTTRGASYIEGEVGSMLTTVPASMPLLTFPGRSVGSSFVYYAYTNPNAGGYALSSVTSPVRTFTGPWCVDLTGQSMSGTSYDMRNAATIDFVNEENSYKDERLGFGIVNEPWWGTQSGPPNWGAGGATGPFSIPSNYASGNGEADTAPWGTLVRGFVLHAYGGSTNTSGTVRYWWKGSGQWLFRTPYYAASKAFSVDVTNSVTPPSVCTTTVSQYGANTVTQVQGYWFTKGGGIYSTAAPNWYGATDYVKYQIWETIGGYSEDTATVAYYAAHVSLENTGSLVGRWSTGPSYDSTGSEEPTAPPNYGGGLPEGSDVNGDWAAQFSGAFTSAVDSVLWPFRAFQAWIR